MLREVIKEHHAAEPHHPEFEIYNQFTEITSLDILETAVDRLSRNLQFNDGEFNSDQIRLYEPAFVKNHETRICLYRILSEFLKPIVKETWDEMVQVAVQELVQKIKIK